MNNSVNTSSNNTLCYVTAFLNLDRTNWLRFARSSEAYFEAFKPLPDLFRNELKLSQSLGNQKYELIIFVDESLFDRVNEYCKNIFGITILPINEEYMNKNILMWSRLEREREIMGSDTYKTMFKHRLHFPENSNPKYTLINHSKIDFIDIAMEMSDANYFCWVDFGYFALPDRIPDRLLDVDKFDKTKLNYMLINPLDERDKDVLYTMNYAPERIGGFFFFGNRKVLKEYLELFHSIHIKFQSIGLADDDQHLVLRCYYERPELFTLWVDGWHRVLKTFEK